MRFVSAPCWLAVVVLSGSLGCGSTETDMQQVDFYVTVQLKPPFALSAVDRLELVFQADFDVQLTETEGNDFEGDISWVSGPGASGDEFAVTMTGDYFRRFAFEVDRDTWEIDVPFFGGLHAGQFGLLAIAYWRDADGVEQEVGYGTGEILTLPVADPRTPVVIEVLCRQGWEYTCLTGCTAGSSPCATQDDCGTDGQSCEEGCCVGG